MYYSAIQSLYRHVVYNVLSPELQYLLKVKKDLSQVLIFQHAILDAK